MHECRWWLCWICVRMSHTTVFLERQASRWPRLVTTLRRISCWRIWGITDCITRIDEWTFYRGDLIYNEIIRSRVPLLVVFYSRSKSYKMTNCLEKVYSYIVGYHQVLSSPSCVDLQNYVYASTYNQGISV